jgi:dihydroflavonol-4-reductase
MSIVLVTGATGFVGSHCIVAALNAGHRVRGTVRSLSRATEVRTMVAAGGARDLDRLEFVEADLNQDDGWGAAVAGCDYVLHTASPFPARQPDDPDELIRPARDGALRVLRAAPSQRSAMATRRRTASSTKRTGRTSTRSTCSRT